MEAGAYAKPVLMTPECSRLPGAVPLLRVFPSTQQLNPLTPEKSPRVTASDPGSPTPGTGQAMRMPQGATVVMFHRLGPYHVARLGALAESGDIVCLELSRTTREYGWEEVEVAGKFQRLTLCEDSGALPARELRRRLAGVLDRLQPKVLALPSWSEASALAGLEWAAQNHVPTVLMSETTAWDAVRRPAREGVKRAIVGLFATALVGGTAQRDYLVGLGMPAERIFLGYDAVDNGYFADQVAEVRRQKSEVSSPASDLRPPASGPYFLASARFIEKKNLPRLIEAYASYRRKAETLKPETLKAKISDCQYVSVSDFTPWDLVLLGDGELRPALTALRSALGLDACVHLPGFIQYPELPSYYARAGAFIHASTTEQWGLVVNEAMASGLPVLVSNRCGCATDLVHEGVNGFTFDPYNVEEMANAMLRISAFQDVSLAALGDASRKIISQWGPERFAQGLKAAVEKALSVGSVRPRALPRLLLLALLRLGR